MKMFDPFKSFSEKDRETIGKAILKLRTVSLWMIFNLYIAMNVIAIISITTAHYVVTTPAFLENWVNKTQQMEPPGNSIFFFMISTNYILFPLFVGLGAEKIANIFIPLLLLYRLARWVYKKKYSIDAPF